LVSDLKFRSQSIITSGHVSILLKTVWHFVYGEAFADNKQGRRILLQKSLWQSFSHGSCKQNVL